MTSVRIARVIELEPIKVEHTDAIDQVLDRFSFSVKTLLTIFIFTIILLFSIWATWNLKNSLKIDIVNGPHHETIDELNNAFGI